MLNPVELLQKLPGFKFSDSHFKVGSKIHVSDFYYAKKIFQNSFFTTRFAYVLSTEIAAILKASNISEIKNEGLTLIGYGQYADLLMSITKKMLGDRYSFPDDLYNYNILTDSDEMRFTKNIITHPNIVIVTPVASTLSTSIKIEKKLLNEAKLAKKDIRILTPHLNILLVKDSKSIHNTNLTSLEEGFGWDKKKLSDKSVNVTRFFEEKDFKPPQKFLYVLETDWQEVHKCRYCFPDIINTAEKIRANVELKELPLNERPLFEADKSPLAPPSNFGLPRGRIIKQEDLDRHFKLTTDLFVFGHHYRNDNHFSYSMKTEQFLVKNMDAVKLWLEKIREKKDFSNEFPDSENILIIAPSHHSNAVFISLINDVLFASSANIIHYDASRDYIQNFNILYGTEIKKADKIVYVDDSLKSGSTFFKIAEFIHSANKIIHSAFFLINKSESLTFQLAKNEISSGDRIFAFANLHLYISSSHDSEPPLKTEMKRYMKLIEESYLDSLKVHFIGHYSKLSVAKSNNYSTEKSVRHLMMLDATHRIIQFFSNKQASPSQFSSFDDFATGIKNQTKTVITLPETYLQEEGNFFSDYEYCLLKVVAQLPFTLYQPLKTEVFKWTMQLMDDFLQKKTGAIKKGTFNYKDFRALKFLIRRVGLLNSNYLICTDMTDFLRDLYDEKGIDTLLDNVQNEIVATRAEIEATADTKIYDSLQTKLETLQLQDRRLKGFAVFYCAQVKELLLSNEARCVNLEKKISRYTTNLPAGFKQVLRILRVENSLLLERFYDFLNAQNYWPSDKNEGDTQATMITTAIIKKILEENVEKEKHYSYSLLKNYFDQTNQSPPLENLAFLNYIWLKLFLDQDSQGGPHTPLIEKTETVISKLIKIVGYDSTNKGESFAVGAFFIVKDNQKNPLLFFDKSPENNSHFADELLEIEYLTKFLNGIYDESGMYYQSIREFRKSDDSKTWEDLYATNKQKEVTDLDPNMLPEKYNRLILVRLNKRNTKEQESDDKEKGQGIIGFYYSFSEKNDKEKRIMRDINITRYLHILRKPLSAFIERHLENNEFTDWRIAENTKRLLLLTGHGKEMLTRLGEKDELYKKIALSLEHIQFIILSDDSSKTSGKQSNIKKELDHYFNPGDKAIIDKSYFERIKQMAAELYRDWDEVEVKEECDIIFELEEVDFSFSFSKKILDLICFEILINAKKNRWIFLENKPVSNFSKNKLIITARTLTDHKDQNRKLELVFKNTGPEVDSGTLRDLNSLYKEVKKRDATAGTTLFKTIFKQLEIGGITYNKETINENEQFAWFIVKVTLNETTYR